ncbi:MAG: hypothetical protein QOE22_219 [Candidatus Parcubacteria bacterium]|jgi:membrane protein DedA with SNARE-associated domain|nr:hypothetical protein [Candidatus Parcubacteria bacterium]
MIENAILYIQAIIVAYGAWGVFLATLIEEVVSPIPSAFVPLASGFFLLSQTLSVPAAILKSIGLIAIPVAIGICIGSGVVYALGYYGGKPIIEKCQRWLGITWKDIERIERRVIRGKRDEITLIFLRLVPIIPGVALSGFCGVVRYPLGRFMLTTFIGSGVRAVALALLGWQAGEFYLKYLEVIERFEKQIFVAVAVVLVLLGLIYYFWVRKRNRRA